MEGDQGMYASSNLFEPTELTDRHISGSEGCIAVDDEKLPKSVCSGKRAERFTQGLDGPHDQILLNITRNIS